MSDFLDTDEKRVEVFTRLEQFGIIMVPDTENGYYVALHLYFSKETVSENLIGSIVFATLEKEDGNFMGTFDSEPYIFGEDYNERKNVGSFTEAIEYILDSHPLTKYPDYDSAEASEKRYFDLADPAYQADLYGVYDGE